MSRIAIATMSVFIVMGCAAGCAHQKTAPEGATTPSASAAEQPAAAAGQTASAAEQSATGAAQSATQPATAAEQSATEAANSAGQTASAAESSANQSATGAAQSGEPLAMNQPSTATPPADINQPAQPSGAAPAGSKPVCVPFAQAKPKSTCEISCKPARVHFAFNSSEISNDDKAVLDQAATCLKQNDGIALTIEGGTDEVGSAQFNLTLGQQRADAVADYLKSQGVNAQKIETSSLGKDHPLCMGQDESCHAQNRRVQLMPHLAATALR